MNKNILSKRSNKHLFTTLLCICLSLTLFLTACSSAGNKNNGNSSITSPPENNNEASKTPNNNDTTPIPSTKPVPSTTAIPSISPIPTTSPIPSTPNVLTLEQRIKQKISAMTLKEKVAQLFVITPEALTGYKKVTSAGDVTRNALKTYPVGGLIYFGANIITPDQLTTMTTNTQNYANEIEGMPLILSIDEEGGTVARIGNNSNFSVKKYTDMASIGASKNYQNAYEVGATIGSYLHQYGLNLDFAPDADVLTNPKNTVIGNRSFGTDGNLVAKMDLKVAQGLADHQILSCFKHFPGHGSTEGDSHKGFAYTNRTLDELMKSELVPFQAAVDHNIPFIMISHISVPKVIGDNTPSSLSKVMITDILRNQMGYDGIIITDSMSMGAIVNTYGAKDAVIMSLKAGADIILMPQDFKLAYQGVLDAVADGTISEQRINESLERILRVKLSMSK